MDNLIKLLKNKKLVFPHPVSKVIIEETHISWVLLTGKFAYKIKKNVRFGNVLNFSSLKLRKKFCQKEFKLNKKLCPTLYKEVVKLIQNDNELRIVKLSNPKKAKEYAVKMKEVSQEFRMDNLVKRKKITKKTIRELCNKLKNFHKKTSTNIKISQFGLPTKVLAKIDENFRTLEKLAKINSKYEKKLVEFVKKNKEIFMQRINDKKIRDIHGDLYMKNIFVEDGTKFYFYDRLEFNDKLRFADVLEDVAHLAMDLDFYNRDDLSKYFINEYIKSNHHLIPLVYFWMCYKACMRAKVSFFRAKNIHDFKIKHTSNKEAKKLLRLAEKYMNMF